MFSNDCCPCLRLLFLTNGDQRYEPYSGPTIDLTAHGNNYLKRVEYNDASEYVPEISRGKVVKVHSDCTISIAASFDNDVSMPPTIYRFSIWLFDRNMQELTSNSVSDQNSAEIMKNILSARIFGKMVDIKNITMENHGRIVADVFCENEYINKWIMDSIDLIKLNRT